MSNCPEMIVQHQSGGGDPDLSWVNLYHPKDISLLYDDINKWPVSDCVTEYNEAADSHISRSSESSVVSVKPKPPPKPKGWNKQLFIRFQNLWQKNPLLKCHSSASLPDLSSIATATDEADVDPLPKVHRSVSFGEFGSRGRLGRPFRALTTKPPMTELRLDRPLVHKPIQHKKPTAVQITPSHTAHVQANHKESPKQARLFPVPFQPTWTKSPKSKQHDWDKIEMDPVVDPHFSIGDSDDAITPEKTTSPQKPTSVAPLNVTPFVPKLPDTLTRSVVCLHLTSDPYGHCPLCRDRFNWCNTVVKLPCDHRFHPHCIDDWMTKTFVCPHCQQPIMRKGKPLDAVDDAKKKPKWLCCF